MDAYVWPDSAKIKNRAPTKNRALSGHDDDYDVVKSWSHSQLS